jgi:transcriptional regulator with XRE-family HTH domain
MEQLKRLRAEKGLSQARLAARAGLDPSTVNQIERGAREASPATLRKLAEALDVGIAELLGDISPKVESRSSLEPSFNDVLKEERREATYDIALSAARRQAKQDAQAANRALESNRPQTYFMHHENEAVVRLLQHSADELAGDLLEMARHVVELEARLEAQRNRSSEVSRKAKPTRSASA